MMKMLLLDMNLLELARDMENEMGEISKKSSPIIPNVSVVTSVALWQEHFVIVISTLSFANSAMENISIL